MRIVFAVFFAVVTLFSTFSFAEDAEGTITAINEEAETITLDDGKTYKLPGEFDIGALAKGEKVMVSYDIVDTDRFITFIESAE
ncbi:MAG: DUF1344 domain-containing protein [Phyllobacterium sp.]